MKISKIQMSQVLSTLKENIQRTGDPLGFKGVYWTKWANELNLPRSGSTILLTARMYQMLPYIIQTIGLVALAKPLLSSRVFGRLIDIGNRLVGEKIVRLKAIGARAIKSKGKNSLKGIVSALSAIGQRPAYLYEDEPYSGVLLYDLGLDEYIEDHIKTVYSLLKGHKVKKVIGVDPHTTFMLKEVYPKYIGDYDIEVKHYLEILSENNEALRNVCKKGLEKEFVIHDPCFMARNLGIIEQARRVSASLGITLLEPENTKLDTACCGGPIEYAFREMSEEVSRTRIQELGRVSKNIVVTCPICLINLSKYEREMGIRVWDMGELLCAAL